MPRSLLNAFACLFVLAGVVAALPAQAETGRLALLIGNSRYEEAAPLRNPENDIELVAAALEKSGFVTTKVANVKLEQTVAALDGFVKAVEAADNPVVMVYFAGHGVQLDGENYLLPVDVKVGSKDEIKQRSLSLSNLAARLDTVGGRLQIIVLDSCRDNPFEDQTRGLQRGLAQAPEKLGKLVAFSTSPGNVAADGDTGASPYASALAESVAIPGLTLEDVFKRVRATVKERTGGKQEPWENSAVYGDFRFIEAVTAKADTNEVAFFEFAALADSQEAYQKYLSRFPDGMFASLARQKIEFMDKDFSFRRQSETFPYVTFENNYDDRCGRMAFNKSDEKLSDTVLDGEIVLMTFLYWLPSEDCKTVSHFATVYTDLKKRRVVYSTNATAGEYTSGLLKLSEAEETDIYKAFRKDGQFANAKPLMFGVSNNNAPDFIRITFEVPDAQAQENILEMGCEDACEYFRALVRFHDETIEEGQEYRFEFVSAAELGLTWKYQNTLRKIADDKKTELASLETRGPVPVQAFDAAAAQIYRTARDISGWDVIAVLSESNTFQNCRAFRKTGGSKLAFFRKYPDGRLSFGHYSPSFNLPSTLKAEIEFSIDGGSRHRTTGKAYSAQEVAYDLGTSPELLAALRSGSEIRVENEPTSLAGSNAMLTELNSCVTAFSPAVSAEAGLED